MPQFEFLASKDESESARADAFWLALDTVKIPVGEGNAEVFTLVDGRASAVAVTIGARTDKSVEVTSSVYPGMRIIDDGLDEIQDGTLVDVQ